MKQESRPKETGEVKRVTAEKTKVRSLEKWSGSRQVFLLRGQPTSLTVSLRTSTAQTELAVKTPPRRPIFLS